MTRMNCLAVTATTVLLSVSAAFPQQQQQAGLNA
jgi:hypothetical protein